MTGKSLANTPMNASDELTASNSLLEKISVRLSVELGAAKIRIRDLLELEEGGVVELESELDAPLAIYANNALLGRGEIVKNGNRFGIRITEISDADARLAHTRAESAPVA